MQLLRSNVVLTPFPDEEDCRLLDLFAKQYGSVRMAPVVVVVPAYNEGDSIGAVLESLPHCCEPVAGNVLEINILIVIDGATDETFSVAANKSLQNDKTGPRIFICCSQTNRGQGAALRLGYGIAKIHGAQYVVTLDADGQYDASEINVLLEPLISGRADLVTGSRVLGRNETTDPLRKLGTHAFAWLTFILTGKMISDTSFGFRAMRAEIPGTVLLSQPQYQAAELLIGVLSKGYRVEERPMTMRKRLRGTSKKGNNLFFGFRFLKVVLGTWVRGRRFFDKSVPPAVLAADTTSFRKNSS